MNDYMLILTGRKGNLLPLTYFFTFFQIVCGPLKSFPGRFGLLLLNFGINKGYHSENRR